VAVDEISTGPERFEMLQSSLIYRLVVFWHHLKQQEEDGIERKKKTSVRPGLAQLQHVLS
jgi:hypothetical protein